MLHRRKAGVQANARNDQPDAVRSQHPQQVGAGRVQHGLLQCAQAVRRAGVQACADDDGAARTFLTQRRNQGGHRRRWRTNHGQVRHAGQRGHIRPDQLPADARALGVDQPDRPFEARALEVAQDHGAQAVGLVRCADQSDRGGLKQGFKVADAHKVWGVDLTRGLASKSLSTRAASGL